VPQPRQNRQRQLITLSYDSIDSLESSLADLHSLHDKTLLPQNSVTFDSKALPKASLADVAKMTFAVILCLTGANGGVSGGIVGLLLNG
jgi:hypothetical protein